MVAVKGAKMPKSCMKCDFGKSDPFNSEVYCNKLSCNENIIIYEDERLDNCPLVEIVTCEDCNNHGNGKEHPDIDGARYCSALHTYTGYDFYCGDAERKE